MVTLTGLGTETFENSLDAIAKILTVLGRQFPEGKLIAWQPPACSMSAGHNLVLTNRYFTKQSEAANMTSTLFPSNVDPKQILSRMTGSQLIHTEENQVKYYTRYGDLGGPYK